MAYVYVEYLEGCPLNNSNSMLYHLGVPETMNEWMNE